MASPFGSEVERSKVRCDEPGPGVPRPESLRRVVLVEPGDRTPAGQLVNQAGDTTPVGRQLTCDQPHEDDGDRLVVPGRVAAGPVVPLDAGPRPVGRLAQSIAGQIRGRYSEMGPVRPPLVRQLAQLE